ncbi:MAG: ankyrin repeat domain-containing protein [Legionella sp.]|jgi:ankyrin repeat protein
MANIIELMKKLDYPTDEKGVCYGLTLMAERARLCGQYNIFKKRMLYIAELEVDRLLSRINEAEKQAKELKHVSIPEEKLQELQLLLTIKTFLAQVWSYHSPSFLQQFLEIKGKFIAQYDIKKTDALMYDASFKDAGLKQLNSYNRYLIHSEKVDEWYYLRSFLNTISTSAVSIGVLINNVGHAIHLFYDNETKLWNLTSHSSLISCASTDELIRQLIVIFKPDTNCNLSFTVFMDRLANNQKLHQSLYKTSQESLKTAYKNYLDSQAEPLLHLAAQNGHLKVVQDLLAHNNIDVNIDVANGATPLFMAAQNGYLEVVKALLAHKYIEVNKASDDSITPLLIAAQKGFLDVVIALLADKNIKVNKASDKGITALYMAAQNGHLEVVQALLADKNIQVNKALYHGVTPLFMAAQNGHLEVVIALLADKNIEVNKARDDGVTPLFMAAQNGHIEVVKALLAHEEINVNAVYDNGETPLLMAAQNGHLEVVEALLADKNIQVNKARNDSVTPLFMAARNGHLEVVQALLAHKNIEVNKARNDGITPLQIATNYRHSKIVDAIKSATVSENKNKAPIGGFIEPPTAVSTPASVTAYSGFFKSQSPIIINGVISNNLGTNHG